MPAKPRGGIDRNARNGASPKPAQNMKQIPENSINDRLLNGTHTHASNKTEMKPVTMTFIVVASDGGRRSAGQRYEITIVRIVTHRPDGSAFSSDYIYGR